MKIKSPAIKIHTEVKFEPHFTNQDLLQLAAKASLHILKRTANHLKNRTLAAIKEVKKQQPRR